MSRTGLILRQWVERDGCQVVAYQAYAYDTGVVVTSKTEVLRTFRFPNEWRAMLCESRMSTYKKSRHRNWLRYFERHVNPPLAITSFNLWFLLYPPSLLTILVILVVLIAYLLK